MQFNDRLIDLPNLHHVIDRSPLTISPDSYVIDAIALMNEARSENSALTNLNSSFPPSTGNRRGSSYILIVEERRLLGIFTERDIVRLVATGRDLTGVKIAEVMTKELVTLTESEAEDIFTALSILQHHQIRHLPIVDDRGQWSGIVTETSFLQAFDLVKMVGIVAALKQHLQVPPEEFRQINRQIEAVRDQTHHHLQRWVQEQSSPVVQANQKLQHALEELQIIEEELRQQNETLVVAHEIAELERQRYQDLFEFAPDGYLVTDTLGIIKEANQAAAALFAVRQKYLFGKPLVIFIAEPDRYTFISQLKNLQSLPHWEVYIQPRQGPSFPISIRVAPVYDLQGEHIGWRWLLFDLSHQKRVEEALRQATDELENRVAERTTELMMTNALLQQEITERQRAEDALQQSENLYRQLVEAQTDLIFRIDLQGCLTFANAAFYQTVGSQLDDLQGQSVLQFVCADDLPIVREAIASVTSPPYQLNTGERQGITVNGICWFQWNLTGIKDDSGAVVEIQGVGRDITERKQMEEALRASEEKFRHFAENIHAIIWIDHPESGENLYVNPAYETIWGRSCQSLRDDPKSWLKALHPEDREIVQAKIEQQKLGTAIDVEYRILRPDGTVRWIWDRSFPINGEQGQTNYYCGIAEDITERKQAEESLRESEEKFRHFAENTQAIIWIANNLESEANLYINPAYERIWGHSCQSLRDDPNSWANAVHPEDWEIILGKIEQQKLGAATDVEYRILRPDGKVRWIWDRGFALRNEQGQIYSYAGIAEDITERKQAEELLRESQERLSLALEAVHIGIWDWNMMTNEVLWSDNMGPLYGLPIGSRCPSVDDFDQLIYPEDQESVKQIICHHIWEGSRAVLEFRTIWPDGSIHWLNIRGQAYYDEMRQPIRMIGTTRDISDRKQAEQQIHEQAALLDIATDAIFVRDFQTQILFWNRGAQRLYGWSADEALGQHPNELFYPGASSRQEEVALRNVIKSGSWQGELNKVTKSGQEIIVESRWTLMRDSSGQPKSILTVDTNITEKKLIQAQFFRTQRLESLGTLAGGIAHDLNNILTPILAASQLLQTRFTNSDERYHQLLTIIESNGKRGASLVKQVLSFARGFKGERTIVQVKHLIAEIIQIARQTFPKSIEFFTSIPEDLWAVCGDVTQLHQVLMNLVVNARDAMPQGGTLKIVAQNMFIDETYTRMHLDAKVGNFIVISVSDSGIGMPPEILDRIFEPFFTTKELGTGTGLGLSTALGIIKNHNGFINVTSQVGKGSQFKLFLPSVESLQSPDTNEQEISPGEGELILVVDDEVKIREVATMILENHNYRILVAANGIEAIAIYAQYKQQISLVLMDVMMPEMDGITTIRTLQKMNPHVKVIACSGLNTMEVLTQAADLTVQAILPKPYTATELLYKLQQLLRV
jgi:PAS domain S-box-containing protein